MEDKSTPLLKAAKLYHGLGYQPWPCTPKTKHPTESRWQKRRLDWEETEKVFTQALENGSDAMGITVPRGVAVIDVDVKNGVDGRHELESHTGLSWSALLESAATVGQTGSGGWHLWYQCPDDLLDTLGAQGGVCPGVDIRANGRGFIVVPPSTHPETKEEYQWQQDNLGLAQAPDELNQMPVKLASWLRAATQHKGFEGTEALKDGPPDERVIDRVLRDTITDIAGTQPGSRNQSLNRAAHTFAGVCSYEGADPEEFRPQLTEAALSTGLSPGEVDSTITSAFKSGANSPFAHPMAEARALLSDSPLLEQDAPKKTIYVPTISEIITRVRREQAVDPIPLPWNCMNDPIGGGLYPGVYTLVGGTGTGKTQLALQVALHAAKEDVTVLYLALELSEREIVYRLAALEMGDVAYSTLLRKKTSIDTQTLKSLPIRILTPGAMRFNYSKIADFAAEVFTSQNNGLLVLDFLQLVSGKEDLRNRIQNAAYTCTNLARRYNISVLLLSSTARTNYAELEPNSKKGPWDQNAGRYIGLGKESGEIEYASSGVFVLAKDKELKVHLGIAKNRMGEPTWGGQWFVSEFAGGGFDFKSPSRQILEDNETQPDSYDFETSEVPEASVEA